MWKSKIKQQSEKTAVEKKKFFEEKYIEEFLPAVHISKYIMLSGKYSTVS